MKKLLSLFILVMGLSLGAFAQQKKDVTQTSTAGQKVHNTFSKDKHYNGYKVKEKRMNGLKTVHKVNDTKETVKDKSKKEGDLSKKVEVTHK